MEYKKGYRFFVFIEAKNRSKFWEGSVVFLLCLFGRNSFSNSSKDLYFFI